MFDALAERLQGVFKSLRGQGVLTEARVAAALREFRLALLEADVHFKVVKQFLERVRAHAVGQDVLKSLSPDQAVLGIVRDEMVERAKPTASPPTQAVHPKLGSPHRESLRRRSPRLSPLRRQAPRLAEAVQKGLDDLGFDGVVFAVPRAATDRIELKKQGYSRGMREADGRVIEAGRETIDQAAPVLGLGNETVRMNGRTMKALVEAETPEWGRIRNRVPQAQLGGADPPRLRSRPPRLSSLRKRDARDRLHHTARPHRPHPRPPPAGATRSPRAPPLSSQPLATPP